MLSEQQQRIMGYFIEEAKDHLNTIEQGLLNLRATIDDPEMVNEVFRAAHSVKGGAAMLGLTSIQHTAHRLEDYFKLLKECQVAIDEKLETLLLRVYDTLQELLEQLQGPFGLTDDKAEAAMAEVEPVFTELNQHFSQLVAESGITPPEDVNLTAPIPVATEPVAAQTGIPLTAVTAEASALRFIFQNDIPARLREMLQLFKQADAPESRQQLSRLCQIMAQPGEQLDLPDWCQLLATAEQAVGNSEISYRSLAPIVIKDIKRAQEQILAGDTQVAASPELLALLPAVPSITNAAGLDIPASEDEFALFDSEAASVEEDGTVFDLPATESELSLDLEPLALETTGDDLSFDFDLIEPNHDSSALPLGQPVGPEVGSAELNSLADLFEGEDSDLTLNWQEEILPSEDASSLDLTAESDFSDLLFQENSEALVFDDGADNLSALLDQSSLAASSSSDAPTTDFDFGNPAASSSEDLELDFSSFDEPGLSAELDLLSFEDEPTGSSAEEPLLTSSTDSLDDLFSTGTDETGEDSLESADFGLTPEAEAEAFSDLGDLSDLDFGAEALPETTEDLDLTSAFDFSDSEPSDLNLSDLTSPLLPSPADPWEEGLAAEAERLPQAEDPFAELADLPENAEAEAESLLTLDEAAFDEAAFDETAFDATATFSEPNLADSTPEDLADLGFDTGETESPDLDLSEPIDFAALGEEAGLDLNWEETMDSTELAAFHLDDPEVQASSAESALSADDLLFDQTGLTDAADASISELTDLDFNQFADSNSADLDLFDQAAFDQAASAAPVEPAQPLEEPLEELPAELDSLFAADLTPSAEPLSAEPINLADFELPADFAASDEVVDIAALAENAEPAELSAWSDSTASAPSDDLLMDLSIFDEAEQAESAETPASELGLDFGDETFEALEFESAAPASEPLESDLAFDLGGEPADELNFGLDQSSPETSDLDLGLNFDEPTSELDFGLSEPSPETSDLDLNFDEPASELNFGLSELSSETSNLDLNFDEPARELDFGLSEPSSEVSDLDLNFDDEPASELNFGLDEVSSETSDLDLSFDEPASELDLGLSEPSSEASTASDLSLNFDDELSNELNVGLAESAASDADLGLSFEGEAPELDFGLTEPAMADPDDLALNFGAEASEDLNFDSDSSGLESDLAFGFETAVSEQTESPAADDFDFGFSELPTEATTPDFNLDFTASESESEPDLGLDFGDEGSSEPALEISDLSIEPTRDAETGWDFGNEVTAAASELSFDASGSGFDGEEELSELGSELDFESSALAESDLGFDLASELAQPDESTPAESTPAESDFSFDLEDQLAQPAESADSDLGLDFETSALNELDFGSEMPSFDADNADNADNDLNLALGEAFDGASFSSLETTAFEADLNDTTGADDLSLDFGDAADDGELNFEASPFELADSDLNADIDTNADVDPTEALFGSADSDLNSELNFDMGELESPEQDGDLSFDFETADSSETSAFESGLNLDFGDQPARQTGEFDLADLELGESELDFGEPAASADDADALDFGSDLDLGLGNELDTTTEADWTGLEWTAEDNELPATESADESESTNLDLGLAAGLAGLGAAGFAALRNDHPAESDFDFDDFNAEPTDFNTDFSAEPSPELTEAGDLDDLDALLAETDTAEPAPFDDLAAVLAEDAPSITAIHEDSDETEDDFADLEALLEDDTLLTALPVSPAMPAVPTSSAAMPVSGPPQADDEFGDLEAMLQDADQALGGGTSPTRKSASNSARRPNRRNSLSDQTMRVSVKHLDNLNNLVGEMVVNRNSLEQAQERLRQFLDNLLYQVQQLSDVGQRMRDLYERSLLESSLLSGRRGQSSPASLANIMAGQTDHATGHSFDALEMDRFTGFHTLSQEMIELIVRVRESASDIDFVVEESDQVTRNFRQITTQLQEGLTRSRMVPFSQTADRLPRGVRDNSLKYGKQAELIIEGRDTLIDKMIVELLYDPMTHLVNNAIAHGIETPEERIAAGKSPTGQIIIRTFHQGNQTVISVSDDGAGINPEAVRAKALAKGVISATQAREMSRLDTYDLLFHHGFSTVDQVDDLRGRGVGLDVVRSNLNEIRGTINIDSTIGKGTTFTIRLPLTLSISKALCCISNRARIAFPMDGVEDMLDVPKERVQTDEQGRSCIQWRDQLLPFQPLSDLLRYNRILGRGSVYGGNQEDDMISIVVLRSAGNFLALQVDQVLGEQEIVIKQLEGPVPKPLGVAGATVLGDGRIMPIADVLELIDLWEGRVRREAGASLWDMGDTQAPQEVATKTEPTVLIVDDSITVRELLSMTFSKVGYRVEQARDGQEAWEKLRSGLPCDLVFCDIEMPRMDGLELLSRIQKDANLNHLPIAMLTSRGADRHRQMAVQLGAKGYFTKPYLEEMLLDAAQRMLKGEVMVTS